MARSAKRRGRKRAAKTRRTVRKSAKKRVAAKRSKRKVSRPKASRRAAAKRKPEKRKKTPKPAPVASGEPWPMILAVMIALLVGLVAAWQFGGATMAANAATYLPLAGADVASILAISDYGCGNVQLVETWLMVAHPSLVPAVW